jgi:O-antigen ligase
VNTSAATARADRSMQSATRPMRLATPASAHPLPRWAAAVLASNVLFTVGRLHEMVPGALGLKLPLLSIVGAVVVTLIYAENVRMKAVLAETSVKMFLVSLAFVLMSVPGSEWVSGSLLFMKSAMGPGLLSVALLFAFLNDRRVFSYSINALIGVSVTGALLGVSGRGLWVVGRFGIGYTLDPNTTAALFVMALPFVIVRATRGKSQLLISLLGTVLLSYGIVLTGSRGGLLGLAAGLIVLAAHLKVWRHPAVLVSLLTLSMGLALILPSDTASRLTDVWRGDDYNVTSEEGRLFIWKRGMTYAIENPLLGVGVGAFPYREGTVKAERGLRGAGAHMTEAHSIVVQVVAELGFVGGGALLLALAFAWGALASNLTKLTKVGGRTKTFAIFSNELSAASACLVGTIVCSLFLSIAYSALTYFVLAISISLTVSAKRAIRMRLPR